MKDVSLISIRQKQRGEEAKRAPCETGADEAVSRLRGRTVNDERFPLPSKRLLSHRLSMAAASYSVVGVMGLAWRQRYGDGGRRRGGGGEGGKWFKRTFPNVSTTTRPPLFISDAQNYKCFSQLERLNLITPRT